jgi:phage gpG-like protein
MATVEFSLQAEFPYRERLSRLAAEFRDSVGLKMDVGRLLKSLTQETFERQASPWGVQWKPSKRVTGELEAHRSWARAVAAWESGGRRGRRPKQPVNARGARLSGRAQTLVLTGRLRNSFEVVHAGNTVSFVSRTSARGRTGAVSNVVYFPAHQWGYPRRNLPARPMMPIRGNRVDMPAEWREDIKDLVKRWLEIHAS